MLKTGKRLRKKRMFSEDFKRKVVADFENGDATILQLSRQFKVAKSGIYKWIYQYSAYNEKNVTVVEMKDSQINRIKELEVKLRELERAVGQKQMKIDFLERMIELAEENFSIDIKKNSSTPHSGGSNKTRSK